MLAYSPHWQTNTRPDSRPSLIRLCVPVCLELSQVQMLTSNLATGLAGISPLNLQPVDHT